MCTVFDLLRYVTTIKHVMELFARLPSLSIRSNDASFSCQSRKKEANEEAEKNYVYVLVYVAAAIVIKLGFSST